MGIKPVRSDLYIDFFPLKVSLYTVSTFEIYFVARGHYGKEMVRVELGKKEVRSRRADWMRLSQFLDSYPHDDLYLVHSISGIMLGK